MTSFAVTPRGAGVTVKPRADSATVAAAVRQVLGDSRYRDAAARLGDIIRADAASGMLVTELEDLTTPAQLGDGTA